MIRLQDMGNSFAIVNKKTDKIKAQQQQIAKSSFHKRNYDMIKELIKKVEQWSEKWLRKKKF